MATAPGGDEGAQVHVADDGGMTWIRDYQAETATASGPDFCNSAADLASVASSVVEAVTRAMSCLPPAGDGRRGPWLSG